jgi:hypothetical protein
LPRHINMKATLKMSSRLRARAIAWLKMDTASSSNPTGVAAITRVVEARQRLQNQSWA